jgi:hypothetical protein
MILAEILKFIGVCISTVSAIIAVYFEGSKSSESGKLTHKGKSLILSAVIGVLIAGGSQVAQVIDALESAESIRIRQEESSDRLEKVSVQIMRGYYPLEPIYFIYELEYSMDLAVLSEYSDRVRKSIVQYLRNAREGRKETRDDLSDENVLFVLSNNEDWMPKSNEKDASGTLKVPNTSFSFAKSSNKKEKITFSCVPPSYKDLIVTLPSKGDIVKNIELYADYTRRVFIKRVKYHSPIRTGNDTLANSSIDLNNRILTWAPFGTPHPPFRLAKIALLFPYDYKNDRNARYITIPESVNKILIKPAHLGLVGVINDTMQRHNQTNAADTKSRVTNK